MMQTRDRLVLVVALAFPTLVTWLYFVAMADAPATLQQGTYAVAKGMQFLLPVVCLWGRKDFRVEPGSWAYVRPDYGRSLLVGAAFGFLVLAAAWVAYRYVLLPAGFFDAPLPAIQAKVAGMQLDTPARFLALGLFYSLGHSLLEEYYWRWFVFFQARRQLAFTPAAVVASLGFMAHHVLVLAIYFGWTSPATYLFSLAVAVGGLFWAWLYEKYGTLAGPWISHLLIDAVIFLIGYDLVFHRAV